MSACGKCYCIAVIFELRESDIIFAPKLAKRISLAKQI